MNGIEHNSIVRQYLDRICSQIKVKSMHEEIRLEILSHLEDLVAEKVESYGKTEGEAIGEALNQMGDPDSVGKQLNNAHKLKIEWSVLALVVCMLVIGLVTLYSLKFAMDEHLLFERKMIFVTLGIALMSSLYFFDYRRLLHYSRIVYVITLLLMFAAQWHGPQISGAKQWIAIGSFDFNVYAVSPYFLILAAAGMLQTEQPNQFENWKGIITQFLKSALVYMVFPACFYITAPAFASLIIYSISLGILLLVNKKWKLLLIGVGFIPLFILTQMVLYPRSWEYSWERYTAFIHPDLINGGYYIIRSVEAIHTGGMWGQGFGIETRRLPLISSELTFSYLVYSLGWVFGITVVVLTLLFISRIIRMGMNLHDGYAKGLVVGLTTVIGIQFVWNLLMCIGMLPILGGMQLPLLNWSKNTLIELGAVGLMLSIYRRKDLLGSSHQVQTNKVV
ncbi:FtsW/RodA/SpoVE family cell cycle protein [Paenibacillus sp. BC26]|uniref:FtsW/RodA/SpoVE family cell cycle protein n=1 Tax=Paenibacillus sp. BC26 TaxID=1881032 RepID=UPI002109D6DC|nr:FtsW/RodA/SpoVE family cell cycle protein [Paenibacillus sp. BC26]